MKRAIIIWFMSISVNGFSQSYKQIDIPPELQLSQSVYYDNKDIWEKLRLADLQKNSDSLIIRITDCCRVIEIDKKNGIRVFPIVYGKHGLITKEYKIDTINVNNLIQEILKLQIDTLPDDIRVDGYQFGQDGISTGFEFSTPSRYRYFSYWCPDNQPDSLIAPKYANMIIKTIENYLNWIKIFDDFRTNLRPGRYKYCMIIMDKERNNIFKRLFH